jgi:predicted metal-binding protein
MIYEYDNAVIFHFPMRGETQDDHYRVMAGLSELERAVFLAGYYKVFLMQYGSCMFCKECVAKGVRDACVNKAKCRPGADAMGIDIYQTAHNVGYPVQVVKQHDEPTNRFAFLLID